jgi:WD40 repeat protein
MKLHLHLRFHTAPVTALTTINDDLVSGDEKGSIVQWNMKLRRPLRTWTAHDASILQLQALDGCLISQGRDDLLKIWRDDELLGMIPIQSLQFCCFDLYQSTLGFVLQDRVVSVSLDDIVRKGQVNTQSVVEPRRCTEAPNTVLSLCFWGKQLIAGCEGGQVVGLNPTELLYQHREPVLCLASQEELVVSGSADGKLILYHLKDKKVLHEHSFGTGISKVAFFASGIVVSCWDASIKVLDISTFHFQSFSEHRKGIRSLVTGVVGMQEKTRIVACGSDDYQISIWIDE